MSVSIRHTAPRRRPWGTLLALTLLATSILWVLIPLARGETIPDPRDAFSRWMGGEVHAEDSESEEDSGPAEGKIRVFVSGRRIPAYRKIVRDDLWSANRNTWAFSEIDEELAKSSGILIDFQDIVGRVLAHEKAPGYVFSERDFLPEGTRPGLAAGVPAGKRAFRIDVETVQGIVGLQPGDRFDMVSAQRLEGSTALEESTLEGFYTELIGREPAPDDAPRARAVVLVQNGVVVTPLETREIPISSSGLTGGTSVRTIPVQEMVIALDPEEVAPLMEAFTLESTIVCLARSGRPEDPVDSVTPSSKMEEAPDSARSHPGVPKAPGGMSVVESIDDQGRSWVPVPDGGADDR